MTPSLRHTICLLILCWSWVGALLLPPPALASEPPLEPILRIETGMHTAMIMRIGIDTENRYLVTGSLDKTVRLWELSTGRLLKIYRHPLGEGHEGKINAVALSPDGKTIASGGYTGYKWDNSVSIYLFDRESGLLIKRIAGLPNAVANLAYSQDGRFLAATCSVNGLRIYNTRDYTLAAEDRDYDYQSLGADFDRGGRLVTTSLDGFVRLYDRDFKLTAKKNMGKKSRPFSVSFSPNGSKVAVGFYDSVKVEVLSGKDLSPLYSPDISGVTNGYLDSVSWSADGGFLYAGEEYDKQIGDTRKSIIRKWTGEGRGEYRDLPASENTIIQILPLRDGGVVYGATDPAWGVFDTRDNRTLYNSPSISDYRVMGEKFLVSSDGTAVQFSYVRGGKSPARFSILNRLLDNDPRLSAYDNMSSPLTALDDLNITAWKDFETPKLNGKALKLIPYEMSRSLAISPDKKGFILGTEWLIRFFDLDGNEKWKVQAPGVAWGVNIAANGKVAVAALGDGTIRWYRMSDGKELLAFFPHNDKKRWVLWTPSGYYDASPGAEEFIGWHINNGKDKAADFFPVSRFRNTYYRPDMMAKVLDTLDEGEALRLANEESNRKKSEVSLEKMLPPVATVISPADGALVSNTEITVKYTLRSPSGEPVTGVRALVDGRPAAADRVPKAVGKGETPGEIRINIPRQDCEVSIIAENRFTASEPATARLRWRGASIKDQFVIKPKLYLLAVGVSKYQDKNLTLGYAAKDARDFAASLERQKGGLYQEVTVKLLTDEKATKDEILDGLEWLQRETTHKDVAMIFIAGHGVNDPNGIYYFLPINADTDKLKRTGVVFSDIKNTVMALAGKAVLFVDTCHAGNIMGARRGAADINALVNELASAESGAVVFASSTGKQYSMENPAWGNGAFTKALVEGVGGRADYTGQGKITINMLAVYLSERVKELTKGLQTPTTAWPQTIQDFPVAVKQ